jgi:hypothetical protein
MSLKENRFFLLKNLIEIAGLKLPNVKLARSFSVFSGCVTRGIVGVVEVFTVVLQPPVNFKSAN